MSAVTIYSYPVRVTYAEQLTSYFMFYQFYTRCLTNTVFFSIAFCSCCCLTLRQYFICEDHFILRRNNFFKTHIIWRVCFFLWMCFVRIRTPDRVDKFIGTGHRRLHLQLSPLVKRESLLGPRQTTKICKKTVAEKNF